LLISAIVFKERITSVKILGIVIVLIGVILIISKGNPAALLHLKFNPGDPLMLLAAFTFAVHSILIKNKPKKISIISLQYTTFFIGMILLLPFYLFSKRSIVGFEPDLTVIGAILYIGICSSLISFVSWNKAIDKIGASSAGMVYYLMPLFSGLVAWVLLDEKLKYYHLISGILIVTGILISNHRTRRV
jgi:drug/metabolite transporter (DMT)-like permease